jgi:outer membrane protein assembly factor BamB
VTGSLVVQIGSQSYRWSELPLGESDLHDWAHHGVLATPNGEFIAGTPSGASFFSSSSGDLALELPTNESHGLTIDHAGDQYTVWLADNGRKMVDTGVDGLRERSTAGRVVRVDLAGQVVQEISAAELPESYRSWRPCSVATDQSGDAGRIFVADGYGLSLVHAFSGSGRYLWTTDGADSGVRFSTPHAVVFDTTRTPPRLLVADRGNRRIVVLSPDGQFVKSIADGELSSPSGLALDGDRLWVAELFGGIVVIENDQVSATYGTFEESDERMWPNVELDGQPARPSLEPGTFRSPHGIAAARDGRIAVTEWLIGGRLIVLDPIDAPSAGVVRHRPADPDHLGKESHDHDRRVH